MIRAVILIFVILSSSAAWAQQHEITKSRAMSYNGQFENLVATYGQELADWQAHMARVKQDKKDGVAKDNAFQPYPAPTADAEIAASVDANGKPNYKITDDSADVLAAKKSTLLSKINDAEQNAVSVILPPAGKREAIALRENDIRIADAARAADIYSKQGVLASIGIGKKTAQEIQAEVDSGRPTADTDFLQQRANERQRIEAVRRAGAQMMSNVEDLTAANIDSWTMPSFPN
jgi:hypothetical protein